MASCFMGNNTRSMQCETEQISVESVFDSWRNRRYFCYKVVHIDCGAHPERTLFPEAILWGVQKTLRLGPNVKKYSNYTSTALYVIILVEFKKQ
jgi:hypothetical protein